MKRIFDFFSALFGLAFLLPFFIVIAIAIKLDSKGPVFYRQIRVGKGGKDFRIWKFRSMVVDADKSGQLITVGGDKRITRVGAVLRKTKIDELPQLINVLVGEMSLVGPRPEVRKYVDCYTKEQSKVLELVPGITDEASIRFRNENELLATEYANYPVDEAYRRFILPEKIRLNLEYAAHRTLWTDFCVILRTVF